MGLTLRTQVQINTTLNERQDFLHGVYSRAWDRLNKIVKKHSLTISKSGDPIEYSTFGNGFHMWTKKTWITASSSIRWKNSGKENEEMFYIGSIKFHKNGV